MAKAVKIEALPELGLDQPNKLHIQESYLRQIAHGKPFTAKKKRKSDVAGTGAKMFRQKGTGRARQGERRNPHMTGGGLAVRAAAAPAAQAAEQARPRQRSALSGCCGMSSKAQPTSSKARTLMRCRRRSRSRCCWTRSPAPADDICLVLHQGALVWRCSRNIWLACA